ncbi:MAG: transcriptional regulator, partial [Anaerolineae bacterium]
MDQYVYWHAPLWEVLLVVLISLAFLGWLVIRTLRRPDLPAALSAIHPTLNEQPLFYFDRAKGVTCLNNAAQQTLDNLPASQQQPLLNVLTDALFEAYTEARVIQREGWPEPHCSLIVTPISRQPGSVTGVLALVTAEAPLPTEGHPADEYPTAELQAWLTMGPALRLHRTRPVVHVRRIRSATTPEDTSPTWQEHQLSHAEEVLLRFLFEHPAEVQTAETLFCAVWPDDAVDRYGLRPDQKERLRRLIYQLRQHVEPDPRNPRYVCTAHGV